MKWFSAMRRRLARPFCRIALRWWIGGFVLLAAAVALIGILFIRRTVPDYEQPHRFTVADPAFFSSAHALADPLPLEGNRIELLHNGNEIFPAMLESIRGARKSINFEAFLFNSGEVADGFLQAFAAKAREGVKVRILLDGIGSGIKLDDDEVAALEEAGCAFAYFNPTRSWRVDRVNLRTHRRVLVVDGRVGFTGGVGFSDEWRGNADAPEHWRDVHARLEGPIVTKLQAAFQQHWFGATGETLAGPEEFPRIRDVGPLKAQVVDTAAFAAAPLSLVQAVAFASATKSIYITNAYCAPSEGQARALVGAVKRGVEVRLILPGPHNDQPMTKAAGRLLYGDLLEGGVKIYEYQPTMMHAKTMVVDGLFSVFGSSNFDARSERINDELDVTVYDAGFGQEMERVFFKDIEKCKPYTLKEFHQRGIGERLSEWISLIFHAQL